MKKMPHNAGRGTKSVVARTSELPVFPGSAAKLTSLLTDERSAMEDFEEVIRSDPGMTTNLLRLVNSSYFGLGREISTVRQAVSFLGTHRLLEIVTSALFSSLIPARLHGYATDARSFWIHSVAVAVVAERVAAQAAVIGPDLTFTVALLHDIGKIVISQHMVSAGLDPLRPIATRKDEEELLYTHHGRVGEELALQWHLPKSIAAVIRWHHCPSRAPKSVQTELVDVVHVADAVAHAMGFGADERGTRRAVDRGSIERLGLSEHELRELVAMWRSPASAVDEILTVAEDLRCSAA